MIDSERRDIGLELCGETVTRHSNHAANSHIKVQGEIKASIHKI